MYQRKATFTVTTTKQGRVFAPINKRAKTVVKRLGKRSKVSAAELKSCVGQGSYKFYQYSGTELKAIRF